MKKLIFDLDGTLYEKDDAIVWLHQDKAALDFLKNNTSMSDEEVTNFWQELKLKYKYGVMDFENQFDFSKDDFCNYICNAPGMAHVSIVDGVDEALLLLSNDKYIFTDNTLKQTIKTLKHLGVDEGHFKGIFHAKSGDYLFKPNLDVYKKFLQDNKLEAKDCIMFEDSVLNLKPAKDLGMVTVLISDKADKYEFCDYYFKDVVQALEFLKDKI